MKNVNVGNLEQGVEICHNGTTSQLPNTPKLQLSLSNLNQHSTQQFLAMETRDPPLPTTTHDFPIFSPTHMHTNSPPNII